MTGKYTTGARYFQVAQNVWGLRIGFVNVYLVARQHGTETQWVLVDTGPGWGTRRIRDAAISLFGEATSPMAIVLTHGHADHTGGLKKLLETWDVPVYAHKLERPYLTAASAYPPADPLAGGGLAALISWAFPMQPVNISGRLCDLEDLDKVPFLPEWRVIHTPGHTPGHISLFRELNATLIAGDAFLTTSASSLVALLAGSLRVYGPPKYATPDWWTAEASVRKLANLQPRIAATGHGPVVLGQALRRGLDALVSNFRKRAVPKHGRYVQEPSISGEQGTIYVPPFRAHGAFKLGVFAVALAVGFTITRGAFAGLSRRE